MTRLPWWRSSIAGYSFTFPIVALGVGFLWLAEYFLPRYYFPSSSLFVAILCVALYWGVGPGLLATLLSCIALFYLYFFDSPMLGGEIIFQLLPFALAGLIIAVIVGQREKARRQALLAEEVARRHAANLSTINEQLRQANQFKDLFVSITSHELKTPITTIRGQAQLALRRLKKQNPPTPELDSLRDALVKVDEQTSRLTNLLNELLDLTSLRSGKQELVKETCDLNEICENIVEEQRMLSDRLIELELAPEPLVLQADVRRIGQVVTNLLSNALKYSPPESVVRLKVERSKDGACFSVQDAGQGISSEHLEAIFQPFYRTVDARISSVSGTGLGLAICKDIVEQHQGRIWCKSSVGHGSTFFVELPLSLTSV